MFSTCLFQSAAGIGIAGHKIHQFSPFCISWNMPVYGA